MPNGNDPTGNTDIKIGYLGFTQSASDAWGKTLSGKGAQIRDYDAIDSVVDYLIKQLDRDGNGKIDDCDAPFKSIGIVGYSWGGWSVPRTVESFVDDERVDKDALTSKNNWHLHLGMLDPVGTQRPATRIRGAFVDSALNIYETNGGGLSFLPNSWFVGQVIPGGTDVTTNENITNDSVTNPFAPGKGHPDHPFLGYDTNGQLPNYDLDGGKYRDRVAKVLDK